jgi:hypothetical protein
LVATYAVDHAVVASQKISDVLRAENLHRHASNRAYYIIGEFCCRPSDSKASAVSDSRIFVVVVLSSREKMAFVVTAFLVVAGMARYFSFFKWSVMHPVRSTMRTEIFLSIF